MKKKVNLGSKLALDKETIARLDEQQLKAVAGGATVQSFSCNKPAAIELDEDGGHSCCDDSCNKIPQA